MDNNMQTEKKALYKRPVFWIVIAVLAVGVAAAAILPGRLSKKSAANAEPSANALTVSAADDVRYFATVNVAGVYQIDVSTPKISGGVINADESPFAVGEDIYLEGLDGYKSFGGVSIKAYNKDHELVWEFSDKS